MRFTASQRAAVALAIALCFGRSASVSAEPRSSTNPTVVGSPKAATTPNGLAIGIGVGAPLDYEQDIAFADAVMVGRAMEPVPGVTADSDGWLNGDGDILVWAMHEKNNTAGTYKLRYDGRAKVEIALAEGKLSAEVYDKKTNTSTREVELAKDQGTFKLVFRDTTAGVKHVKLMRPLRPRASTAHGFDEMWYRPMKEVHQPFQWIRTMDMTATNGQNVEHWKDRTLPSRWSQQNHLEGTGWQGRGAAWEYVVHMANDEQKDLWICVPLLADDDYVKKLAQLIHYGSDGVNPYTSPQAKPVWAPLAPNLKLYVEYSNEIWNFGFAQWTQLLQKTRAEIESKKQTELNYDGSTSDGEWNTRHWARRVVQISRMFRAEFGDAAMMTRIRPVFETQLGWADNYLYHGLTFIDAWYNNGDGKSHVQASHPVNYYVWGGGGSTYPVGFPDKTDAQKKLTVAQFFAGLRTMLDPWTKNQQRDIDYLRAFGLKRISYEGGTGVDNKMDKAFAAANATKDKAQRDAKIGAVYAGMLKRYSELGGDGHTNFLTTNPTHGVVALYDGSSLDTPKLRAIRDCLRGPRPRLTWGVALPATFSAGRYRVSAKAGTGDGDQPVEVTPTDWFGYTVRTDEKATYALRVSAASAEEGARLNVWIDGSLAGTLNLRRTSSGQTFADSERISITLEPGQHGIRLDGLTGTFSVKQVVVEAGSPATSK